MNPEQFIGFYPCHDLSATRDFYERDLGLELARDQESCLIFRVTKTLLSAFVSMKTIYPVIKALS